MSEKVKVSKELASIIENTRKRMGNHEIVANYNQIASKWKKLIDLDTLIKALYIGYEVEEFVSFEEAMKALKEGKTISFHYPNRDYFSIRRHWKFDNLEELYDYSFEDLFIARWTIEADTP